MCRTWVCTRVSGVGLAMHDGAGISQTDGMLHPGLQGAGESQRMRAARIRGSCAVLIKPRDKAAVEHLRGREFSRPADI